MAWQGTEGGRVIKGGEVGGFVWNRGKRDYSLDVMLKEMLRICSCVLEPGTASNTKLSVTHYSPESNTWGDGYYS